MMGNIRLKRVLGQFSLSMVAQIISLFVSVMMVLYTPRKISVEGYGYWQLYLMYTSVVGFFHLGFNDGIYLRKGGEMYEELDKGSIKTQLLMVFGFEYLISVGILLYGMFFVQDTNKSFVVIGMAIYMMIVLPYSLYSYLLQACGKVQWYSFSVMAERLVFFCSLLIIFEGFRIDKFQYLIIADLCSRSISLIILLILCRKIWTAKLQSFTIARKEVFTNIYVGVKLMLSNIASTLIITLGRLMIENKWDIATFGKVSLSISLSNFMVTFLTAISIVLFPILRNLDANNSRKVYHISRTVFVTLTACAMIVYVPMKIILVRWLPQYEQGLRYLAILFPMCLFEARLQLVSVTYLKVYRKENMMLLFNLISVAVSAILCAVAVYAIQNVTWAVVAILIAIMVRSILFDLYAEHIMKLHYPINSVAEVILAAAFALSAWFAGNWGAIGIYAAALLVYILLNIGNIKKVFVYLHQIKTGEDEQNVAPLEESPELQEK